MSRHDIFDKGFVVRVKMAQSLLEEESKGDF